MKITMRPIGIIHSPFNKKSQTPIQSSRSQAIGLVEVHPEFADGLKDIEALSHIYLIYFFHASSGYTLQIKPFLDNKEHGIFATRYPYRPNPIGISIVKLLSRRENSLTIEGIDTLDGTPLLDIKPYVPDFDLRTDVHTGWYETRSEK
jgi:tRNA (adenine37-N6)-methyltransferase